MSDIEKYLKDALIASFKFAVNKQCDDIHNSFKPVSVKMVRANDGYIGSMREDYVFDDDAEKEAKEWLECEFFSENDLCQKMANGDDEIEDTLADFCREYQSDAIDSLCERVAHVFHERAQGGITHEAEIDLKTHLDNARANRKVETRLCPDCGIEFTARATALRCKKCRNTINVRNTRVRKKESLEK